MPTKQPDQTSGHDRITHIDLLTLLRSDIRDLRYEMRWLIGIGFVVIFMFIALATFVR